MDVFYTILINEDHSFTHSIRKRIMQRSNNIDQIRFLVNPTYNDLDMAKMSVLLECRTPISHTYIPITLQKSEELYKNRIQYILPLDLKLTKEFGELELTVKFTYLSLNDDGTFTEHVRTIGSTSITIDKIVDWSDYIPTSDLDNIVQIMLTNQSILKQQKEYAEMIAYEKADNIAKDKETNEIYLTSNGVEIGSRITDTGSCDCEDGVAVTVFENLSSDSVGDNENIDNVIEF